MNVEFINRPISGKYQEKIFDIKNPEWESSDWSWVKFTSKEKDEWVGQFRGNPIQTANANEISQAAVLTEDGLFIVDTKNRIILFHDFKESYRQLSEVPKGDKFIIADFIRIGEIDKNFNVNFIDLNYDIDNIEFDKLIGNKLRVKFAKTPDYKNVCAYVNTESLVVTIE